MLKRNLIFAVLPILFLMFSISVFATDFKVRIENISQADILKSKTGATASLAFSPGACLVHTRSGPVFIPGKVDRGQGLESQAEDGDPSMLAKSLNGMNGIVSVAAFNTPVGKSDPGPIRPGDAYEFTLSADPASKAKLTVTFMWGQSNDLFYAPGPEGIALFDKKGTPLSGEITSRFSLWDAGTEVNEEPGFGPNQGPRQSGPNTGPAEHKAVNHVKDAYSYPEISKVLKITITPQ